MKILHGLFFILLFLFIFPVQGTAEEPEKEYKVLAVMSYAKDHPWVAEVREGIDTALDNSCEVHYFYMDTKKSTDQGKEKGRQAYNLYQRLQPDGVIAMDDNAQAMFVVPFLRDKVKIPVMFGGVNETPEAYGYPATNVSGILDRFHIKESISFTQSLCPYVKSVAFVMRDCPTSMYVHKQVEKERDTYSAKYKGFYMPKTLEEARKITKKMKTEADMLFLGVFDGLLDAEGKPMSEKEVTQIVTEEFGKPTACSGKFNLKYGALCAVVKTGQEQGETAAEMLLEAMKGKPVSDIPVRVNHKGKRMINVDVMKKLGVQPKPEAVRGAALVRLEQ